MNKEKYAAGSIKTTDSNGKQEQVFTNATFL